MSRPVRSERDWIDREQRLSKDTQKLGSLNYGREILPFWKSLKRMGENIMYPKILKNK